MTKDKFINAAHDDIKAVLRILSIASTGGARSKPTIKQLNDIVDRLQNADKFLNAAKGD